MGRGLKKYTTFLNYFDVGPRYTFFFFSVWAVYVNKTVTAWAYGAKSTFPYEPSTPKLFLDEPSTLIKQ